MVRGELFAKFSQGRHLVGFLVGKLIHLSDYVLILTLLHGRDLNRQGELDVFYFLRFRDIVNRD